MKRILTAVIILGALLVAVSGQAFAANVPTNGASKLVPPPAIYLPFDAKVVSEINFSSQDVLGILGQVIPLVGKVVSSAPRESAGYDVSALANVDFQGLADAIAGIENVRVLVATYRIGVSSDKLLAEFDKGAAKTGTVSRILSDIAFSPGATAFYARSDGKGYIGYTYDVQGGVIYGARIVGSVDVMKLMTWIGEVAKAVTPGSAPPTQDGLRHEPTM